MQYAADEPDSPLELAVSTGAPVAPRTVGGGDADTRLAAADRIVGARTSSRCWLSACIRASSASMVLSTMTRAACCASKAATSQSAAESWGPDAGEVDDDSCGRGIALLPRPLLVEGVGLTGIGETGCTVAASGIGQPVEHPRGLTPLSPVGTGIPMRCSASRYLQPLCRWRHNHDGLTGGASRGVHKPPAHCKQRQPHEQPRITAHSRGDLRGSSFDMFIRVVCIRVLQQHGHRPRWQPPVAAAARWRRRQRRVDAALQCPRSVALLQD